MWRKECSEGDRIGEAEASLLRSGEEGEGERER